MSAAMCLQGRPALQRPCQTSQEYPDVPHVAVERRSLVAHMQSIRSLSFVATSALACSLAARQLSQPTSALRTLAAQSLTRTSTEFGRFVDQITASDGYIASQNTRIEADRVFGTLMARVTTEFCRRSGQSTGCNYPLGMVD